jgi:hypothetical protein
MDIHVVSTLTSEDEERVAGAVMEAVSGVLDKLPIAYAVRVETNGVNVLQHTHLDGEGPAAVEESRRVGSIR